MAAIKSVALSLVQNNSDLSQVIFALFCARQYFFFLALSWLAEWLSCFAKKCSLLRHPAKRWNSKDSLDA